MASGRCQLLATSSISRARVCSRTGALVRPSSWTIRKRNSFASTLAGSRSAICRNVSRAATVSPARYWLRPLVNSRLSSAESAAGAEAAAFRDRANPNVNTPARRIRDGLAVETAFMTRFSWPSSSRLEPRGFWGQAQPDGPGPLGGDSGELNPGRIQLESLDLVSVIQAPDFLPRSHLANTDRKSTRLNSSHANISYAVF